MTDLNRRSATALIALAPLVLATRAGAASHTVTIRSNRFRPETLTIKQGDTVTWTNQDGLEHTATARDKSWGTRSLTSGKSESITFGQKGSFSYFCKWHPAMRGKIVVT